MRKCSRCKTMLADDYFYQSCEKCRDKQKIQVRQNQLKRIKNGLCQRCGKPTEGKTYCEKCGARRNLESRMRKERKKEGIGLIPRSERISFGLCYTCGNPLDVEGKKMCSKCMSTNYICNGNLTGGVNQHWIRDNQHVFKKRNQKKDA